MPFPGKENFYLWLWETHMHLVRRRVELVLFVPSSLEAILQFLFTITSAQETDIIPMVQIMKLGSEILRD